MKNDLPSSLRLKSCFCLGGVVFRFGLPTAETQVDAMDDGVVVTPLRAYREAPS